jgi:hypothetical protein
VLDSLISAVLRFWCQSTTTKESPTVSTATDMTDDLWDEMVDDQPTSRRFCQTCDRDLAWHRHKVENLEETIGPIAAQEFEQDHPEVEGGISDEQPASYGTRTILAHLNIELDAGDTRTIDEVVAKIEAVLKPTGLDVAVALAEEV